MDGQVIILIGAPGAGKGTQAELLAKRRGWLHLSSGQILRSKASAEVKAQMSKGELVRQPEVDTILDQALGDAPSDRVWVLDGFIRLKQDEDWLEQRLTKLGRHIGSVVFIDIPYDESRRRLALRGRVDDRVDSLAERLREYSDQTAPIIASFRTQGLLKTINGVGSVSEVAARIEAALS